MKYVKPGILIFRYLRVNSGTIAQPRIIIRGYTYILRNEYQNTYGFDRVYKYDLIEYINTI